MFAADSSIGVVGAVVTDESVQCVDDCLEPERVAADTLDSTASVAVAVAAKAASKWPRLITDCCAAFVLALAVAFAVVVVAEVEPMFVAVAEIAVPSEFAAVGVVVRPAFACLIAFVAVVRAAELEPEVVAATVAVVAMQAAVGLLAAAVKME